jgi:hypothetical protein
MSKDIGKNDKDIFKVLRAWDDSLDEGEEVPPDLNAEELKFLGIWRDAVNDFKAENLSTPEKKIISSIEPLTTPEKSKVSREGKRLSFRLAAAALIVIVCGGLGYFISTRFSRPTPAFGTAQTVSNVRKGLQAGDLVAKGTFALGSNDRKMVIRRGNFEVLRSRLSEVPEYSLFGTDIQADFDLEKRIRLTIENQHISLSVIGTAFSVDWNSNQGYISMKRGKITVTHLRTKETLTLTGSDKMYYSLNGLKKIAANIQTVPPKIVLTTNSGDVYRGFVISETEHEVSILMGGRRVNVSKADIIDRINELSIVEGEAK